MSLHTLSNFNFVVRRSSFVLRITNHESRTTNSGFTLLEVLVSVAIMGMIMLLVWSTQSQSLNSKERIEKRDMVYQYGRVALQKITDDLTMAFLTKKPSGTEVMTVPRSVTFFIAEDQGDRDAVRFTTMSHMRLYSGAKESDQCKVKYEVAPSTEERGVMNLTRAETPWLNSETDLKTNPFVLAENIRDFDLEYYDDRKEEWGKTWNTEIIDYTGRLPGAVRITISFPDPDDEERSVTMKTMVLLPMSGAVIEF